MVALKKGVSVRLRRSRDSWGLCLLPQADHSSLFLIQLCPQMSVLQDPAVRHQSVLRLPVWPHNLGCLHPGDASVCHTSALRRR